MKATRVPDGKFTLRWVMLALLTLPILSCAQKKKPIRGYGEASYTASQNEQYMSIWLIAGPVPVSPDGSPSLETQTTSFAEGTPAVSVTPKKPLAPIEVNGKQYAWKTVKAIGDVIDLDKHFSEADFAAGYALAEITSDKEVKTLLGVGSDDGIRIWHNGKLIHDNWIPRGVVKDDDLVPITLQPGSNQLLLKVDNYRCEAVTRPA